MAADRQLQVWGWADGTGAAARLAVAYSGNLPKLTLRRNLFSAVPGVWCLHARNSALRLHISALHHALSSNLPIASASTASRDLFSAVFVQFVVVAGLCGAAADRLRFPCFFRPTVQLRI